jgi:hypothetical protein
VIDELSDLLSQVMESDKTFKENGENGMTTSMLRTDTSLNMREEPNTGICKQTETAVRAEILANCLPSMPSLSPQPSVLTNKNDKVTSGDIHVPRPQLGSDEINSTPVALKSLLEQYELFGLVSYVPNEVSYRTSVRV